MSTKFTNQYCLILYQSMFLPIFILANINPTYQIIILKYKFQILKYKFFQKQKEIFDYVNKPKYIKDKTKLFLKTFPKIYMFPNNYGNGFYFQSNY